MPRTGVSRNLYLHQRGQRGSSHTHSRQPQRASVVFVLLLLAPEACTTDGANISRTFLDEFLLQSMAPEFRLYTPRSVVFAGKEARFVCMALLSSDNVLFQWLVNRRNISPDPDQSTIHLGSRKLQMRYSVLGIHSAHPRDSGVVSCHVTLYGDRQTTGKYVLSTDLQVRTLLKPDGTVDYFPVHADLDELCNHTRHCVGEDVVCDHTTDTDVHGYDVSRCHCSANTYLYRKLGQCVRRRRLGEPCYLGVQCSEPASRCDHVTNTCACEAGFENSTVGCTARANRGDFCDETHSCTKGTICIDHECTCPPDYYWSGRGCRKRLFSASRTRFLFKVIVICGSVVFIITINCLLFYFKTNAYQPSVLDRHSPARSSWSMSVTRSFRSRAPSRRKSLTSRSSMPESLVY